MLGGSAGRFLAYPPCEEVLHAALRLRSAHRARQLLPAPREAERVHARGVDVHLRRRAAAPLRGRNRHGRDPQRDRARSCTRIPRYRQKLSTCPVGEPPRVGGRRPVQSRLPPPPHRAAQAGQHGAAEGALRAHHAAAPRPLAAALGDVDRRRDRGRPLRADLEGPPLHDRRRVGRRPHERAAPHDAGPRRPRGAPVLPAAGALRPRAPPPRAGAAGRPALRRVPRRPRFHARGGRRARRDRRPPARGRGDARHDAPPRVRHAAEPSDRPAPPLRLDGDGGRRRSRRCGARSAAR